MRQTYSEQDCRETLALQRDHQAPSSSLQIKTLGEANRTEVAYMRLSTSIECLNILECSSALVNFCVLRNLGPGIELNP